MKNKTKQQKIKTGIIGYTSELNKVFRTYVEDKKILKNFKFSFYDFKAKDKFSILGEFLGKSIVVKYPDPDSIKKIDLLLVLSQNPQNKEIKKLFKGKIVDVLGALKNYDILYQEDTIEELREAKIIKVPSSVSYIIFKIFKVIRENFGLEWGIVNIFLPASFKEGGVDEFVEQVYDSINMKPMKKKVFKDRVAFNFLHAGNEIEKNIENELDKLLSDSIGINASFASIFHSLSFFLQFKTKKNIEKDIFKYSFDIEKIFNFSDKKVISPVEIGGSEKIHLSKLKEFNNLKNTYFLNASADNYISGKILSTVDILNYLQENLFV